LKSATVLIDEYPVYEILNRTTYKFCRSYQSPRSNKESGWHEIIPCCGQYYRPL